LETYAGHNTSSTFTVTVSAQQINSQYPSYAWIIKCFFYLSLYLKENRIHLNFYF